MKTSPAQSKPKYRRILLKLSGEALGGDKGFGISPDSVHDMAQQIREVRELGVEVVIVIGGGDIFRGLAGSQGGDARGNRGYIGKLATRIQSPRFQDSL